MREVVTARNWQLRMLAAAVECADLALISVWSPTWLMAILDTVADQGRRAEGLAELRPHLSAARYHSLVSAVDADDFSQLWPDLRVISVWADGPSLLYARRIARRFPQAQLVPKGLFATEGVVSLPWGLAEASPLAIESHFFEFIDRQGTPRIVAELVDGEVYEPVLTTAGGLYRYALGDLIKVTGHLGNTATIRFVGRADLRSDLVGEKLDADIVAGALETTGLSEPAMLVPAADARRPHYVLITEADNDPATTAQALDAALRESFHYGIARDNEQLGQLECVRSANLAALLQSGWEALEKRSGDAKPAALITSPDLARELLARCSFAGIAR
jgi:hypothetical protein